MSILKVLVVEEPFEDYYGYRKVRLNVVATVNGLPMIQRIMPTSTKVRSGTYKLPQDMANNTVIEIIFRWLQKHLHNCGPELVDNAIELLDLVGQNGTTTDDVISMLRLTE